MRKIIIDKSTVERIKEIVGKADDGPMDGRSNFRVGENHVYVEGRAGKGKPVKVGVFRRCGILTVSFENFPKDGKSYLTYVVPCAFRIWNSPRCNVLDDGVIFAHQLWKIKIVADETISEKVC